MREIEKNLCKYEKDLNCIIRIYKCLKEQWKLNTYTQNLKIYLIFNIFDF